MKFVPAVATSAALVLASPVIGQLRSALFAAFPDQYPLILLFAVLGAALVALGFAVVRVRERRGVRYGLLIAALGIATAYSSWTRTGEPSVDAVERFHFVEYGLITFLFYRGWRSTGDGSILILPVLAGLLVGTCEEWLQWFVPARVGEVRDVVLNLWAIGGGLLMSLALDPPQRFTVALTPASRLRVARFAAAVLLAFAVFFHSVHLGHQVDDPEAGVFRSYYTASELLDLSRQRDAQWRSAPPVAWSRYSREDQYFSEGVWHVRARNRCWDQGDVGCAWRENLIAERYYAPVIDTPSYVSATGLRWPADQRDDARRRLREASKGEPHAAATADSIIYAWPKPLFWAAVALGIALLAALGDPRAMRASRAHVTHV